MSDVPRYPIGRFAFVDGSDPAVRAGAITEIGALPARVREVAATLTETQLATPYRDGGWTARRVIHHIADSHVNAYVRTRWMLTEDRPTIKVYDEKAWAELPDASSAPIALSLDLLTNDPERLTNRLPQIREVVREATGKTASDDALMVAMRVEAEYLDMAFNVMREAHGSLDGYLDQVLGLDGELRARLHDRLLA